MLGNPKDKDPQNTQTGITYHYQCPQINCPSTYIGESGRSLGERIKGHFKAPSPIQLQSNTTGHPMDPEQFSIVHKEVNNQSRTIKEAMFIWVQDPALNRNLGKSQLLHIWDHLLMAYPTLQCKPSSIPTASPKHLVHPLLASSPSCYPYRLGHKLYGKYTYLATIHPIHPSTPPDTKYTPLYSSAILVSFLFLFVRLTFL